MATSRFAPTMRPVRRVEQYARGGRGRWFERLARAGLAARAVIYLLLTYLCADIALHGSSPAPADGSGALSEVARQPGGPVLLGILFVGLLGYALWRIISALTLEDHSKHAWSKRLGLAASGAVYLFLSAQAILLATASGSSGSSGGSSSNPAPIAATVLGWPAGPVLLGLVAAGMLIGGVVFAVWGAVHDYEEVLRREQMSARTFSVARATGIAGDAVRGALVTVLGAYLMAAAVANDPSKVKGVDQALQSAAQASYAELVLGLAAFGLFCFAVYSGLEARFRRV